MSLIKEEKPSLESIIKVEAEQFGVIPARRKVQQEYSDLKPAAIYNKKIAVNQVQLKNDSKHVPKKVRKPITRLKYPGPYFCDHCEKISPSRPAMSSHLKFRHFKSGNFQCKECPKEFRENYLLTNHVNACHLKIKPFACNVCKYKSALEGSLKRHIKLMHGKKSSCPVCGKLVSNLEEHVKSVHSESRVVCGICCRNFKNSDSHERHVKLMHKDTKEPILNKNRLSCSVCKNEYNYIGGLQRHWLGKHLETHGKFIPPVKKPKPISMKTFICDFCGKKIENRRQFQKHLMAYHILRNPPLPCKKCDATFTTMAEFEKHRKALHREIRQLRYLCDHCPFLTNQRMYIINHVRTHVKSETKCPICHRFVKVLNRHIQGHKMKTCQICQKMVSARGMPTHMGQHKKSQQCQKCDVILIPVEMKKHMIVAHSEGKNFECHCGSVFKNLPGLKRHKLSHGKKNIPCKDCDLMFNMQTALMQHMKFSHPESYKNRDNKRGTKRSDKMKIKSKNHPKFKFFKGKKEYC